MTDVSSRFPSSDTLTLLRRTLRTSTVTGRGIPEAQFTPVINRICAEAHEHALAPEELLIRLKTLWRQLPEAHERPGGPQSERMRRFISLCIRAYYECPGVTRAGASSGKPA